MARPLRLEYPGAVYHVMARGNQGRPIFADDQDRRGFLAALGEAHTKTGWRVHGPGAFHPRDPGGPPDADPAGAAAATTQTQPPAAGRIKMKTCHYYRTDKH